MMPITACSELTDRPSRIFLSATTSLLVALRSPKLSAVVSCVSKDGCSNRFEQSLEDVIARSMRREKECHFSPQLPVSASVVGRQHVVVGG